MVYGIGFAGLPHDMVCMVGIDPTASQVFSHHWNYRINGEQLESHLKNLKCTPPSMTLQIFWLEIPREIPAFVDPKFQ
jgi:hypothetical protein